MRDNYFDIERDKETEKAGGFWCNACLVSHPAAKQSLDPRYCHDCCIFLLKEAAMLDGHRKEPEWVPKRTVKPKPAVKNAPPVSQYGGEIMSTLNGIKSKVDIIEAQPPKVTRGKRGPKHRELPEDYIKRLASEGMGSKAIASQLKRGQGIDVSYKTIQRVLAGQR